MAENQATANVHMVRFKSRKDMERDIPRERWGWWIDVSAGQRMVLRDATPADVARCILRDGDTRGPDDFFCELPANGSLVSREAVESLHTVAVPVAVPQPAAVVAVPEGWKLVPTKPTQKMLDAAWNECTEGDYAVYREVYESMLAAAEAPNAERKKDA
jgi:hypothetical protein